MKGDFITFNTTAIVEERLTISVFEYKSLVESILGELLTFYDRTEFKEDKHYSHQLAFMGYKGKWEAINMFNLIEWLEYFRAGNIETQFLIRKAVLQYQYDHAVGLFK